MSTVLIQGVRLVDPAAGIDGRRDVLVAGGRVLSVGDEISLEKAHAALDRGEHGKGMTLIRGDGLWLWPGLVDAHVHFREPGFTEKETLQTGALAAAAGGYTSVICEPNTEPAVDSVDIVRHLTEKARRESIVHVYFKAAMTRGRMGKGPTDVPALAREDGVVALSDDGDPVVDAAVMECVCRAAAESGVVLAPHCEDSPRALEQLAAGVSPGFEPGEPYANETNYIERDLQLADRCGCRIHFSHVSLAGSVGVIADFRARSAEASGVTFEAAPHHLLLSTEDFAESDVPKVNPPLRSAEDRRALCDALAAGLVNAIASDHAPHTAQDKASGASGLIGLETTLGLVLTHFVAEGRLSAPDAVGLLSLSPARIFGLPAGTLRPGAPADMVLIDPEAEWTVDPGEFRSKSRNTPFGGRRLRGKAVATYVGGDEVFCVSGFDRRKGG